MLMTPGSNHAQASLTGRAGDAFSFVASVAPGSDPNIQQVQLSLARLHDENGCEKVVLFLAGAVEGSVDGIRNEIQTLLSQSSSAADVTDTVERVKQWAKSKTIAPHATVREYGSTAEPLDALENGLLFTTPQNPVDIRDRLTQFHTKAALYSKEGTAALDRDIPGPKVAFGFDVRGVGEANRVGLGKDGVDAFFQRLGETFSGNFGDIAHRIYRLGGDEFVIIAQDRGVETTTAIKRAVEAALQIRDELLPIDDARVQDAERRLAVRGKMRALFAENYTEEIHTREQYVQKLLEKYVPTEQQAVTRAAITTTDGKLDSGKLTLLIATQNIAEKTSVSQDDRRVLDFVGATVKIGNFADSEVITVALGTIDKITHVLKERPRSTTDEIIEIDPKVLLRAASRNTIASVREVSQHYKNEVEALNAAVQHQGIDGVHAILRQNNLNAIDPEIGIENRVLRLGLIHDMPVRQILAIAESRQYEFFEVSLEPFGPLNNQLGSDRADELFRVMAREIRKLYPEGLLVRRNGGNLVVITPHAGTVPDREALEATINNAMTSGAGSRYERAVSEHEQRVALRAYFSLLPQQADAAAQHIDVGAEVKSLHQDLPIRMEFVSMPKSITLDPNETCGALIQRMLS